jgi:hypothetical protein
MEGMFTAVVEAAAAGAAAHLDVLAGGEPSEAAPIEFARIGKHHRLGRHIEPCRERLSRKEHLRAHQHQM